MRMKCDLCKDWLQSKEKVVLLALSAPMTQEKATDYGADPSVWEPSLQSPGIAVCVGCAHLLEQLLDRLLEVSGRELPSG